MTDSNATHDRRPQAVAALGFVLQLASFGILLGVSIWAQSDAIAAVARFMLIGIPTWLVLFLIFKQVRRVRTEALETAELKRARAEGGSEAIFGLDDESLLLEQNRLLWMIRWLLPGATVLLAIVLLAGHWVGWGWSLEAAFQSAGEGTLRRTQHPTMMMWFVVFVGFLCFLYARYAIALSRMPNWRLLRAGATCMAGNAVACLGLAVALMAGSTIEWAEPLVAYLVRVVLVVIGIEFTANFILDFYRPRTPGILPRPSFESRLMGLVSEPGSIARSIADAINYQFGFEVSSTWFYQLLQRWLFPIMVVTVIAIMSLTSIVIVDADEQVVVERFGRLVAEPDDVLEPGIHFKWPYPIDVVYRAPVRRVGEIVIGESTQDDDHSSDKAVIWTESHDYVPELMLLVASPELVRLSADADLTRNDAPETQSVAVSLLMTSVPVEYRIKDIKKYLYQYDNPEKLLECAAYQYLCSHAAGVDIDELIGPGRDAFNRELRNLLQQRVDELDLGIEVAFVGLRGAHPPAENRVAEAFQSVVSAQTRMAATIHAAHGEARRMLTAAAGTEARARALDQAIRDRDQLQAVPAADPAALAVARQRVEALLVGDPATGVAPLSGQAAALLAEARSQASRQVTDAASKVRVFGAEVAAFEAAPELYRQRKMLEVYETMDMVRKFLVVGDPGSVLVEYLTTEQGGLDRVLSEGTQKTQ